MANPHIAPCTFEELYTVPVAGYHYKPSRAKVVPIDTIGVQPELPKMFEGKVLARRSHNANMTMLFIIGVGILAIGIYAYHLENNRRKERR